MIRNVSILVELSVEKTVASESVRVRVPLLIERNCSQQTEQNHVMHSCWPGSHGKRDSVVGGGVCTDGVRTQAGPSSSVVGCGAHT
jgi:hypothetical protein